MLKSRVRKLGPPTPSATRNSPQMLLPQVLKFIDTQRHGRLHPTRRGTCQGQGSTTKFILVAGVGEGSTASGGDYPVLTAYTTTVVGAAGGPNINDDLLLWYTAQGNPVVLGKLNY